MAAVEAVKRETERLGVDSADVAIALELAAALDNPKASFTAKSLCARALGEAMVRLRAMAPAQERQTPVDDLSARRKRRRRTGAKL